eukprot:448333-Amorphochlora_amoeboformis.AAC.2
MHYLLSSKTFFQSGLGVGRMHRLRASSTTPKARPYDRKLSSSALHSGLQSSLVVPETVRKRFACAERKIQGHWNVPNNPQFISFQGSRNVGSTAIILYKCRTKPGDSAQVA